jgi:4-amino-4-deoxy-L-arabinose transferase-like glycosyltransferase
MLPLVRDDRMWTTGLAGAIPAAVAMTLAATFLFAALRRLFGHAAATAGTAVFLLNPNSLYLGSIPMTEPVFFATLCGLLYFTVRFAATQGWGAAMGAAVAALAGTLTRYEGWALLPFVALFLLVAGPRARWKKRLAAAVVFSLIASTGPLLWLLHNRWYFGDALEFYRGPYSAIAIRGSEPYPGRGDWLTAIRYFLAAGRLVAGRPALLLGGAGLVVALVRKAWWPVLLLALPAECRSSCPRFGRSVTTTRGTRRPCCPLRRWAWPRLRASGARTATLPQGWR